MFDITDGRECYIESLELSAERHYDEMDQGNGMLKCCCGKVFDPDKEGGTITPNPYAMPVCGECFNEAYEEAIKREKKRQDEKDNNNV